MNINTLDQLLEKPEYLHFYNLLGGLSDNLLTIGAVAGTFLTCGDCGHTFTLKKSSWKCERCAREFELKFEPTKDVGTPFTTKVRTKVVVSGPSKTRTNPNWYFVGENWCVAEFLMQILRLPCEDFLPKWLKKLDVNLSSPAELETVLCWPRLRFGGKTIQPDFVVGFQKDLILFEFKRPEKSKVPPREVMGQIAFAVHAATKLKRDWHLIIIPGRHSAATTTSAEYAREALSALGDAQENWKISEDTIRSINAMTEDQVAARIRVFSWEQLLAVTREVIESSTPDSWTRRNILASLEFFQTERANQKLMDNMDGRPAGTPQ